MSQKSQSPKASSTSREETQRRYREKKKKQRDALRPQLREMIRGTEALKDLGK